MVFTDKIRPRKLDKIRLKIEYHKFEIVRILGASQGTLDIFLVMRKKKDSGFTGCVRDVERETESVAKKLISSVDQFPHQKGH